MPKIIETVTTRAEFMAMYREEVIKAIEKYPAEYAIFPSETPESYAAGILPKMEKGLDTGTALITGSRGFQGVARRLGIKATNKEIFPLWKSLAYDAAIAFGMVGEEGTVLVGLPKRLAETLSGMEYIYPCGETCDSALKGQTIYHVQEDGKWPTDKPIAVEMVKAVVAALIKEGA